MFELILKAIISFLAPLTSYLSTLINSMLGLIPGMNDIISNVTTYLNNILLFVPLCLDFLMIPRGAIVLLFDYYIIKYLIYIGVRGLKFVLTLYNKIKI